MDEGAPGPSTRTIRIAMAAILALIALIAVLLLVDVGGGDDDALEAADQPGLVEPAPQEEAAPAVNSAAAQSLVRSALTAVEAAAANDPDDLTAATLAQYEPCIAWSGSDSDASRDEVAFTGDAGGYMLVSTDSAGTRWIIAGGPSGTQRRCEPSSACSDGSW